MKKPVYVKYNLTRKPQFQTRTIVWKDEAMRYVTKEAANEDAKPFLSSFPDKFRWTSSIYPDMSFLPCTVTEGCIRYDYVAGTSLDQMIQPLVSDVEKLIIGIRQILNQYYSVNDAVRCPFRSNANFREIFGDVDCTGIQCIRPANLDVIFDNVILQADGRPIIYDYEWTFDIAVPEEYVIYRILSHIYDKYFEELSPQMDFQVFTGRMGIPEEHRAIYEVMESRFIHHIYTNGEEVLTDQNYYQGAETLQSVQGTAMELQQTKGLLKDISAQLEHKKTELFDAQRRLEDMTTAYEQAQKRAGELQEKNTSLAGEINFMVQSKSWKLTKPIRYATRMNRLLHAEGGKAVMQDIGRHLRKDASIVSDNVIPPVHPDYLWVPSEEELARQRNQKFQKNVTFSIITPLYKTPEIYLKDMIDSVLAQTYAGWDFHMVDFSPEQDHSVEQIVREYEKRDPRIHYERDFSNEGIAQNTNKCIEKSTGNYIAILDHDDILHPSALYEAMCCIEQGADFIYTDEVKFEGGLQNCYAPNFKPDYAPEELLAHNYICHFNTYSRELLDRAGWYRQEANGSQDHDIVLRLTAKAHKVMHIPKILYYWRNHPASVASNIDAKPYATNAGIWSVEQHLHEEGLPYTAVSVTGNIPLYRLHSTAKLDALVKAVIWGDTDDSDKVGVTCSSLVKKCALTDENMMTYAEFKAKADSNDPALQEDTILLFIHAGAQFLTDNPVREMLLYSAMSGVAVVEGYLADTSHKIISAGIAVAKRLTPHIYPRGYGHSIEDNGYENNFFHARDVSAASGMCTMIHLQDWKRLCADNTGVDHIDAGTFIALSRRLDYMGAERIVCTPFVKVQDGNADVGDLAFPNATQSARIEIPERDPFFSEQIIMNRME